MDKQFGILLLDCVHSGFFEQENIRNLPEHEVYEEMYLPLHEFDPKQYDKKMDDAITFGYYDGSIDELLEAVKKVIPEWVQYYDNKQRVYCGFIDGKIASFCLVEDMGVHNIYGRKVKLGGPGCVGTIPKYRHSGIGLTMVKNVTQILKDEGYDYSYIHYTGVAPWYAKLGYQTTLKWNKNGPCAYNFSTHIAATEGCVSI